jgi:RHS repeat-associated protein
VNHPKYTYDNNGNLSSKTSIASGTVTSYSYSSENRLLGFTVTPNGSSSPIKVVNYTYDALGNRIQKQVVDNTAPTDPTKTFTRTYSYSGLDKIREYDGNNNLLVTYTNSGMMVDDTLSANVTASGVAAQVASTAGIYQYLKDQVGTVVDITDGGGNEVQHNIFSAFGLPLSIKNASGMDVTANPPVATNTTFTGREYDSESGLYYYRARYYDPALGRFISKDPLGLASRAANSYIYALNSPIQLSDPLGLFIVVGGLGLTGVAVNGGAEFSTGFSINFTGENTGSDQTEAGGFISAGNGDLGLAAGGDAFVGYFPDMASFDGPYNAVNLAWGIASVSYFFDNTGSPSGFTAGLGFGLKYGLSFTHGTTSNLR